MSKKIFGFEIETEVPSSYTNALLDFIYEQVLFQQKQRVSNLSRKIVNGRANLSYLVLGASGDQSLQVEVKAYKPLRLNIQPLGGAASEDSIEEARQDIVVAVQLFEEKARNIGLYFAWREGEEIIPETFQKQEKPLKRFFLETQILLFAVFIAMGMILFSIPTIGWLAPLILIVFQFVLVFFSPLIIMRAASWHITKENPYIHILQYHLPLTKDEQFKEAFSGQKLKSLKKEIYREVIQKRGEIDCATANKIFESYGFACQPENFVARKINVYALVKKTAEKFGVSTPKIVISNSMLPNAAASGPSPKRGVVLITTGVFVQLDEDEILSILGHEFGHLKGRDPLLLFGLTAGEFLIRFYVLLPLFPFIFYSFVFFLYFWAIMTGIFFIAKFFEARADLISAMMIKKPKVLANALEKIGFRRLILERKTSFRVQEWIGLDPHPPIYFRVNRLSKLKIPVKAKYPLVQSIRDVISGFIESI
ncbi:M48 family metalloprotease [Candidatus Bathyarchaeota archaeon]|nr:M48 family metalloprotease [Candidatus Bathyarchaeota archaeon]